MLSHPLLENLHIVPTIRCVVSMHDSGLVHSHCVRFDRDTITSLALSSRNAYLTSRERELAAPALYAALQAAKKAWLEGRSKDECLQQARAIIEATRERVATDESGGDERIEIRLDYFEMNDPETFEIVPSAMRRSEWECVPDGEGRPIILSGAMWVGQTRLIDNIALGNTKRLGILED